MSIDDFWHKDKRLFDAYQKAYYTGLYEKCWVQGLYFDISLNNLARNILAKKGSKPLQYPDKPFNPFTDKKPKVTKENLEENFRQLMADNSNWLKQMLNKQ